MHTEAGSYGVSEATIAGSELDAHIEEVRRNGYTIVDSGQAEAELARWRARIDAVIAAQCAQAGGPEVVSALGETHTARAPLAFDPAFIELATNPTVLAICDRLLDGYVILNQQNAVINPPAGSAYKQAAFHRDLPYQHFVSSRPLAVSALFCADPFTQGNGATCVLPASHMHEAFPSMAWVARWQQQLVAPAGSYLVFDSMLFHRAGSNVSTAPRRAVNHVYARPFIKQQLVLPALLGERFRANPMLAKLLGYDCDPPGTLDAWFAQRASRVGK